jgi:hypothetical protein
MERSQARKSGGATGLTLSRPDAENQSAPPISARQPTTLTIVTESAACCGFESPRFAQVHPGTQHYSGGHRGEAQLGGGEAFRPQPVQVFLEDARLRAGTGPPDAVLGLDAGCIDGGTLALEPDN